MKCGSLFFIHLDTFPIEDQISLTLVVKGNIQHSFG